jgi:hypothetical protein
VGVSHDSLALKFRIFQVPPEREAEVWEKFELLETVLVAEVNGSLRTASAEPPPRTRRDRKRTSGDDS